MKSYMNPPIPYGFAYVSGTWYKAFTIEDVKNKNRFTWIPFGVCINLDEYLQNLDGLEGYAMKYDFTKDMIKKYQGIYVSTYLISKNSKGKYLSVKGTPANNITFKLAKDKAASICKEFGGLPARTRLMHAKEYDATVRCISHFLQQFDKPLSNEQFEDYGLYGMNDLWIWTLTNHSDFSMILKKGDSIQDKEKVYANNESFESPVVGFRTILIIF